MFISVKFRPEDQRAYTYTYDGLVPIVPGDYVEVDTREGRKIVQVHEVDLPEPPFVCKPITTHLGSSLPPRDHNNPPDPIDEICAAHESVRIEAENWLNGETVVDSEAVMATVDRLRADARQWRLDLERGQKSATAPLYDAYKAEGDRWKPTIEDAKRIEAGLVSLVDGFKRKLAAQKEAERRAAWEAAQAAQREAEEAARKAAADNIEAQREAEAARQAALDAEKAALAKQKDTVKGMRAVTRYEVTDYRGLINWIAKNDRDAMIGFVDEWARRNHKQQRNADGLRVWDEKEAY